MGAISNFPKMQLECGEEMDTLSGILSQCGDMLKCCIYLHLCRLCIMVRIVEADDGGSCCCLMILEAYYKSVIRI